ncbi:hypothetical protein P8452_27741 [Trifolium repens]|nr:hypothetical protein P8452_27741 [Trifolium repens]
MSIMYLTQIKSWFQTKLQDSPQVSENELVSPQGPQCKEGKCSHSTRNPPFSFSRRPPSRNRRFVLQEGSNIGSPFEVRRSSESSHNVEGDQATPDD